MKRIKLMIGLTVLALALQVGIAQSNEEYKAKAVLVAEQWLELVDQSEYEQSWDQTSSFFREAVSVNEWIAALQSTEKMFGKVESRSVQSSTYLNSLPNAPEGEYVVILFEAKLKNGKNVTETVTPMLDEDGEWRVAGYYINPS